MAISSTLSVSLGFLLLIINVCFASSFNPVEQGLQLAWLQGSARLSQEQQRHPLRFRRECPLENLNTLEPSRRIEAEAGYTELWDEKDEQFVCAGSAALRHVIRRRGLLLPSYTSSSELLYVVEGRGVHGAVIPGCPETYQSPQSEESQRESRRGGAQEEDEWRRVQGDEHQKVRTIKEGDVIALPAGITHWIYNDGQSDLVLLSIVYTASEGNQLDERIRKFFLAGNPQQAAAGSFRKHQHQQWGRQQQHGGQSIPGGERESFGNIFSGLGEDLISESFDVENELARRLRSKGDQRGHIVEVQEELQIVSPSQFREGGAGERSWESKRERWSRRGQQGEGRRWNENGIEDTICSFNLQENIDNPVRAAFYNPRGGRITALNSFSLPILGHLQLSAEKGVLYRDAIVAPHFYPNSHALVYVTRGSARIQIVGDSGKTVFDGEVHDKQLFIVPQGFVVLKKAGSEGFEWVGIRTNDVAVVSPLAGRLSVFRALPEDVLVNAYQVSRQEARSLKYNREELGLFSPFRSTTTQPQGSTSMD